MEGQWPKAIQENMYHIVGNFERLNFRKNLCESDFEEYYIFKNPPTLLAEWLCSYRNFEKIFSKMIGHF